MKTLPTLTTWSRHTAVELLWSPASIPPTSTRTVITMVRCTPAVSSSRALKSNSTLSTAATCPTCRSRAAVLRSGTTCGCTLTSTATPQTSRPPFLASAAVTALQHALPTLTTPPSTSTTTATPPLATRFGPTPSLRPPSMARTSSTSRVSCASSPMHLLWTLQPDAFQLLTSPLPLQLMALSLQTVLVLPTRRTLKSTSMALRTPNPATAAVLTSCLPTLSRSPSNGLTATLRLEATLGGTA
mmetsp:Transcript_37875/g.55798  ORF Transcript_37875/g.55798 Transcript_37875/m.55798 type:complete len:243 (+) Transcript_37875:3285-4013(+)